MELNVKETEMLGANRNSDYDTVERLLQEGVNPNKKFTVNMSGDSDVINFLVESLGNLSITELLLKYGADPTMYLDTNVVSGRPMGDGIYSVTPMIILLVMIKWIY